MIYYKKQKLYEIQLDVNDGDMMPPNLPHVEMLFQSLIELNYLHPIADLV